MARYRWILFTMLLVSATAVAADDPGAGMAPAASDDPGAGMAPAASADELPWLEPSDAGTTAAPDGGWDAGSAMGPAYGTAADAEREMLDLTLSQAMAMAIENNLGVQVARHDPLIAWERTRVAWGTYDPTAFTEIVRATVEVPSANALTGARLEEEHWNNAGGLRGLVPVLSTEYEIRFSADRTKTSSAVSSLREFWESGLSFSVSQPLLRNLYWNEPWTEVKLSGEAYGQALEDFRLALMDVVQGVENAYWAVVATGDQERVAIKSLEASRELLEQTKVQYEVGVVSKVEVVEAEAGVAEREVELIRARNFYRTAQDVLIDRVMGTHLTAGSGLEVNPVDRPGDYATYTVDVEEAARKAMERRPELASLDQAIKQQEIVLTFNRNQMAPQVDVVASYGYRGLSGKDCNASAGSPFCQSGPSGLHSNFSSSIEDYFDHDGAVNWSLGGVLSIPLGNHAPRASKRRAEIELRKIRTQRTQLVQSIVLDIRSAARNLRSAQEGIEAAERRRLAAEEQFRAEGIRLEQGESTPFDVLQRERDLVAAEGQKINAFQLYRDAVASLERSQGTILERHNIVVDQARELR